MQYLNMQLGLFPNISVEKIGVKSFTTITLSLNSFLDIYRILGYTQKLKTAKIGRKVILLKSFQMTAEKLV